MRKTVPLDLLVYGYKFHEDTYKKIMSPYLLSDIANSKYLTWKTHFAPLILLDHISDHNVNQKKFITKKNLSPTSKISCPTFKTYNVVKYKSIFIIIKFNIS